MTFESFTAFLICGFSGSACIVRPEGPKDAKNEVKRPEGPPAGSLGPLTSNMIYSNYIFVAHPKDFGKLIEGLLNV